MRNLFFIPLALCLAFGSHGSDWPRYRGPLGTGISDAKNLPIHFGESSNVVWKTPIHDKGWSSPVVQGKQVWLTTATENGQELFAICLDRDTGKVIHDLKLFEVANPQFAHKFNTYASPTPAIEQGRVYITFGSPGTACLDTQTGKKIWERRDLECNHFRGAGSSPLIYKDLLIMNFDGSDFQYIIALDKKTGKTVWKTNRSIDFKDLNEKGEPEAEGDFRKAYGTPVLAIIDGQEQILSVGAKATYAYEPATGKEIWRFEERRNHSSSAAPVVGDGFVYIWTGWSQGTLVALKPGTGLLDDSHVVWKTTRNVPKKPGILLVKDLLFAIDDGGVATCFNAKTGEEHWKERIGGNHSASPIAAEGRIYFFSEEGKVVIIEAAAQFKKIAENTLGDGFMGSPAAVDSALYIRSKSHLYRVEQKSQR